MQITTGPQRCSAPSYCLPLVFPITPLRSIDVVILPNGTAPAPAPVPAPYPTSVPTPTPTPVPTPTSSPTPPPGGDNGTCTCTCNNPAPAPQQLPVAASGCVATRDRERALCLCRAFNLASPARHADWELACVGGFWCGSNLGEAQYTVCRPKQLFSPITRSCEPAASVTCSPPWIAGLID